MSRAYNDSNFVSFRSSRVTPHFFTAETKKALIKANKKFRTCGRENDMRFAQILVSDHPIRFKILSQRCSHGVVRKDSPVVRQHEKTDSKDIYWDVEKSIIAHQAQQVARVGAEGQPPATYQPTSKSLLHCKEPQTRRCLRNFQQRLQVAVKIIVQFWFKPCTQILWTHTSTWTLKTSRDQWNTQEQEL